MATRGQADTETVQPRARGDHGRRETARLVRARPENDPTDVLRVAVVGNTAFLAHVTASLVS